MTRLRSFTVKLGADVVHFDAVTINHFPLVEPLACQVVGKMRSKCTGAAERYRDRREPGQLGLTAISLFMKKLARLSRLDSDHDSYPQDQPA